MTSKKNLLLITIAITLLAGAVSTQAATTVYDNLLNTAQGGYSELNTSNPIFGDALNLSQGGTLGTFGFAVFNSSSGGNTGSITNATVVVKFYDNTVPYAGGVLNKPLLGTANINVSFTDGLPPGFYTTGTVDLSANNITLVQNIFVTQQLTQTSGNSLRNGVVLTAPSAIGSSPANVYLKSSATAEGLYTFAGSSNQFAYSVQVTSAAPPPVIRIVPNTLVFSNSSGFAPLAEGPKETDSTPQPSIPTTTAYKDKLTDGAQIMQDFTNGIVKVVVNLTQPQALISKTDFGSLASLRVLQAEIRKLQQEVINALPASEVTVKWRFENIAAFSAEVSTAGLIALQNHDKVFAIEPVYQLQPHLAQGIPLMNGMTYRSTYNGSNLSIAICDTGVDYNHSRLGAGGFPNSKVIGGFDTGNNDGDPLPDPVANPNNAHGTCCAGIAAGNLGTVGNYIGGVAYGSKIYAMKIVDASLGSTSVTMGAAWDYCITHKNDDPANPILVISTSFGGGRFFSACDGSLPSLAATANNAVAAGITVLASSGNDGYCDSMAQPACLSSVISVGAIYDAAFGSVGFCTTAASCAPKSSFPGCAPGMDFLITDSTAANKVTGYSDTASFLTLLAPSHNASTADITGSAGYTSGDFTTDFGGTSAACPYAAGAVAALQSAAKAITGTYLTPAQVKTILTTTGTPTLDTKVAITKPRINLAAAIQSIPTGGQTFRIFNDGASTLTITSIVAQTAAPWITITPPVPPTIDIPAAGFQDINVNVNITNAPAGNTTNRLLVTSNDSTNSPYSNGVFVVILKTPAAPAPQFTSITRSGGTVDFSWSSVATRQYQVQYKTNVTSGIWNNLGSPIVASGPTTSSSDSTSPDERRFYRVALLPGSIPPPPAGSSGVVVLPDPPSQSATVSPQPVKLTAPRQLLEVRDLTPY